MEKIEFYNNNKVELSDDVFINELSAYGKYLEEMSSSIEKHQSIEEIRALDMQRKDLKADIADKILNAFEKQDPHDPVYQYFVRFYEKIFNKPFDKNTSLYDATIQTHQYIKNIFDRMMLDRHPLYEEHEDYEAADKEFIETRDEYKRLKPIIEAYFEPQGIVGYKQKREPSLLEAAVASAHLMKIKEKIITNLSDKTDAIIIAGSLNWGMFYETRGPGLSRRFTEGKWEEGNFHEQYTIQTDENNEKNIAREKVIDDLSDVDIVLVASPGENIEEIYNTVLEDMEDNRKAVNEKVIKKFVELIKDANIPEEQKPVSINIDFATTEGFRGQMIIFSNNGFKNLYRFNINDLEKIYLDGKEPSPLFHEEQIATVLDMNNGEKDKVRAHVFFHPNLDYKEGKLEDIQKTSIKEFQQALIGGKRIIGQYYNKPIGDAELVDEEQDRYGQFITKYYPFGGFLLEQQKQFGSYFLGINPDNMVLGENFNSKSTEVSDIAKTVKTSYFERIAKEHQEKNGFSREDIKKQNPDIIFGPYISRWARLPKHSREKLFLEFKQYVEKTESN